MRIKTLHYISGLIISLFVGLHLFNHFCSIFGAVKHIEIMNSLRLIYRNIVIETVLLGAVGVQILSGFSLFKKSRQMAVSTFEKLHIWSGLYMAIFFVIHISAVVGSRLFLNLDTNFYFGVAGLNSFPTNLFFIPYYGLAVFSFFTHIASIHNKKMKKSVLGLTPIVQSKLILIFWNLLNVFYTLRIN